MLNLFQPPAGLLGDQEEAVRRQMQQQGLLGLAAGLFQAGTPSRQRQSLGGSALQGLMAGQQMAQGTFDQTLKAMQMRQQMADAERQRQQQQVQQEAIENYISNLPPEQQAQFRAFPTQAAEAMFREQKADPGVVGEYQAARTAGLISPETTLSQYIELKRQPGTVVNVGGGRVGTVPPGYELREDPITGSLSMAPIPGGPEAKKLVEEEQQRRAKADVVIRAGQTLIRDTTTAIQTIEQSGRLAAGVGSVLSFLPETSAAELQRDIDSIKGNIAIDSLLKIKESGAGLGAIPQAQLEALAGLLGSLDTRMSPSKLKANLQDIQKQYQDIVEGEGGDPFRLAIQRGWVPPDVTAAEIRTGRRRYNPNTGKVE